MATPCPPDAAPNSAPSRSPRAAMAVVRDVVKSTTIVGHSLFRGLVS